MRKILIIGIGILLLTTNLKGQSISDIFRLIPGKYVDGISLQNRNKILKNEKYYPDSNDKDEIEEYHLEDLDSIKNFIRIESSFETGQRGFSVFEIRCFTKNNGDKLIVFSNYSGAPLAYQQNTILIFNYKDGKLEISNSEYLPKAIGINDFVKTNTPASFIKKYLEFSNSCYELGLEGDHITYCLYDDDIEGNNIDMSYLLGNTIEFRWNGEKFERTKVINKDRGQVSTSPLPKHS